MASVANDKGGFRRVLFSDPNGERKTVHLGKVPKSAAETVRVHVGHLASSLRTRTAVPPETSAWVGNLDDIMRGKLSNVGLCDPPVKRESMTLGGFLAEYVASRNDSKASTHLVYGHTRRYLQDYFGADRKLETIKATEAEAWRAWLATDQRREDDTIRKALAPNTVRRRTGIARQYFNAAIKRGLITSNPFAGLSASVGANPSRFRFVTSEEIEAVIDKAPDCEWRTLIALARYGGLRVPSEALALTWQDIDWERGRMTVHSSKTAHHVGGESRSVPLFPQLRKHLEERFDEAAEGDVHVITRYRDAAGNLRTQFERIIKRASLKPWGKPWQNLRSSRETELVERFPLHVVCSWLGNSPRVAGRHYLQTTEAHFHEAASETAQNPAQKSSNVTRSDGNEEKRIAIGAMKNPINKPISSDPMGVAGLEPATSRV